MAPAREPTRRSVISFHSIFFLFFGVTRSSAWITVKVSAGVALLLSDRWQDANPAISDLEDGFIGITVVVSNIDAMLSFDGDLVHFVSDRVISFPSQTINASPDHEVRYSFSSRAEQLIDVALAITDMDASSRIAQQLRGLTDIVQPPNALLLLDGNTRRIDLLLKRGDPLEFLPVQNLTAASPSGSPSVVTARLECIRMPQTVRDLRRPALSRPLFMFLVIPIARLSSLFDS
ncbi:hypothetical protein ACVWWR_004370 [Bradyrhizobium sp. LM3.2]